MSTDRGVGGFSERRFSRHHEGQHADVVARWALPLVHQPPSERLVSMVALVDEVEDFVSKVEPFATSSMATEPLVHLTFAITVEHEQDAQRYWLSGLEGLDALGRAGATANLHAIVCGDEISLHSDAPPQSARMGG